jgi:hypothetical protein
MTAIRESISAYEIITNNDTLIIVPACTYVFPNRLSSLFNISMESSSMPTFIVNEQDVMNAYILNGLALNRVRHTKLIDSCLQRSYISARESHFWICIKYNLRREHANLPCENNQCFVYHNRYAVTLAHIKNGSCLNDKHRHCHSMALLYPTTLSDMITLEFFKYQLKSQTMHHSL